MKVGGKAGIRTVLGFDKARRNAGLLLFRRDSLPQRPSTVGTYARIPLAPIGNSSATLGFVGPRVAPSAASDRTRGPARIADWG